MPNAWPPGWQRLALLPGSRAAPSVMAALCIAWWPGHLPTLLRPKLPPTKSPRYAKTRNNKKRRTKCVFFILIGGDFNKNTTTKWLIWSVSYR
jgi:hypothetical protein